jgi:TonB-dependent receptor
MDNQSNRMSNLLMGAAVSALMTVALVPAAAAQDLSGQQDATTLDEVVVTGSPIVGSQAAAIRQQRNADNIVNVIAADTVGQFPDQNAAAALSRLPAVAVQRDQGQERYLQIRGAPNRWTSVSIDGINVIGVDEGGTQRAFRFDAVPAVILSALEVNKSLTPDLSAEAIVARVNLRTFSAFDRRGLNIQGDAGSGEMVLGGGRQEQYSLRGSWSGEKLGLIAAISHYLRDQTTDNRENTYDAAGLPTTLDFRNYTLERESNGGILGLEYRINDDHRLFAKSLYIEFNDNESRDQYVFQIGSAVGGTRTATSGDLVGVPVRGTFNDGYYTNNNWVSTLGGDHAVEGWDVEWRLNYTETENTTDLPIILSQQASSSQRFALRYDRSDVNFPILSLATQVAGATPGSLVRGTALDALTPSAFSLNLVLPLYSSVVSEAMIYKADARRDFEFGGREVELAFGAQYDDREVEGSILSSSAPPVVLTALLPRVGLNFNYANYLTDRRWTTGFPSGLNLFYVDNKAMRRDVEAGLTALRDAGLYNPANNISPTDRYTIAEQLTSAYGSAKIRFGASQLVAGLRVEHHEQEIDGFLRVGATNTPLSVSSTNTDLFPSLNLKVDVNEDTVFRVALATGISRPSFGTIRAGAAVNDISRTISGGNPTLEPERTYGVDFSLERYLSGQGLVSISGFYREVDNVLFDASAPVVGDLYDVAGIDRTGYIFTSTRNGDSGQLYGLELAYSQQFVFLPGWLSGFGFQGNLTLLDGEFETGDGRTADFPGTSNTIVNTSIYYEDHGLSARLSYQWRDDWIDTLNSLGSGEFRKGYESLDLSLRYAVNDNLSVFVDANNLTDEVYIAYEGNLDRPSEVEQIGQRWMAGLRFNF